MITINNQHFNESNIIKHNKNTIYKTCTFSGQPFKQSLDNVIFKNCKFNGTVKINSSAVLIDTDAIILFKNVTLEDTEVSHIKFGAFEACKFININNSKFTVSKFTDTLFENNIENLVIRNSSLINNTKFTGELTNCKFTEIKILNVRISMFVKPLHKCEISIITIGDGDKERESIEISSNNALKKLALQESSINIDTPREINKSITPINFSGSKFENCDVFMNNIKYSFIFVDCIFNNIKNISTASFINTDFTNTKFTNCKFADCNFNDCNFTNANFMNILFMHTLFSNTDFTSISYKNITLQKCHFDTRFPEKMVAMALSRNIYFNGIEITDTDIKKLRTKHNVTGVIIGYDDNYSGLKSKSSSHNSSISIKTNKHTTGNEQQLANIYNARIQHNDTEQKEINQIFDKYASDFGKCIINISADNIYDIFNKSIQNVGTDTYDYNVSKIVDFISNNNINASMYIDIYHSVVNLNTHTMFYSQHAKYLYILYIITQIILLYDNEHDIYLEKYKYVIRLIKETELTTNNPGYNSLYSNISYILSYSRFFIDKLNIDDDLYGANEHITDFFTSINSLFTGLIQEYFKNTKNKLLVPSSLLIFDIAGINLFESKTPAELKQTKCNVSYSNTKTLNDTGIADKTYIISTIDKPGSITKTETDNYVYWLNIITGTPDNLDDFRNITNIVIDNIYKTLPTTVDDIPEDMDFTSELYKNAWFIALVNPT